MMLSCSVKHERLAVFCLFLVGGLYYRWFMVQCVPAL